MIQLELSSGSFSTWQLAYPIGVTLPETNSLHLKWMVGILVSFWDSLFSGAMLVLGSVSSSFSLQLAWK